MEKEQEIIGTSSNADTKCELRMKPYQGFNYPNEFPENVSDHLQLIQDMELRDDDVFITSYPKSGTHWAYEIVYMLLHGNASYCRKHYWLDIDSMDVLNSAPSPRIFITHIPVDRLPRQLKQGRVKVIYMARNPKDVVVSHYCFVRELSGTAYDGEFDYSYVDRFLNGDVPYDSWFRNVLEWEKFPENYPQVPFLNLKFEHMKSNLRQEIEKVAIFLGVSVEETALDRIADGCTFARTKQDKQDNPDPRFKTLARSGGQVLYRKGEVGDWKNWFTVAVNERFDEAYKEKMAHSNRTFQFTL